MEERGAEAKGAGTPAESAVQIPWHEHVRPGQRMTLSRCRALLRKGVDANARDSARRSLLLRFAADVQSLLYYPESARDLLPTLNFLVLKMGARVDAKDREGKNALLVFLETGWMDGARRLLKLGANVHAPFGKAGNVLSEFAGHSGLIPPDQCLGVVGFLLDNGVSPLGKDRFGRTFLAVYAYAPKDHFDRFLEAAARKIREDELLALLDDTVAWLDAHPLPGGTYDDQLDHSCSRMREMALGLKERERVRRGMASGEMSPDRGGWL